MPSNKPSRRRLGREALRAWYAPRRLAYPWRGTRDPYRTLVSEVMLQQTQADRVVPAFRSFLRRFPTVRALAAAPRRDVVTAWAGLGYNRRAVRLSEAARAIARDHGGRIPSDGDALLALPGVGPYTAAAVTSIGFGEPVAVVDTNVRRVVSRVHLGIDGHRVPVAEVSALADAWLDRDDPASWNQAIMDLGREVCRPRPRCEVCPLARVCRFRGSGAVAVRGPARQGPFEGSSRQVRGAVVEALRSEASSTPARLAAELGFARARVDAAVESLAADGLVEVRAERVRLAGP
ncbi:MAG TPA: A/G-specific adenine glycosylase [Actinomycetota bacterium]|nr:A/G-specific adenine glycosylase [Actinomycetota bacterium]